MRQSPYELASNLERLLLSLGVRFRDDGFPEFPEEMILGSLPDDLDILPFAHRRMASSKSSTLICSFENDADIYRCIAHLDDDIEQYRAYLGFCGFDLSARGGMDARLQRFNLLLNAMANTYLAVSAGIPMLPNFRIGGIETLEVLSLYPKGSIFAAGTLGCARGNVDYNCAYLRTKIMFAQPSEIAVYGTLRKEYARVLEEDSVSYRVIPDYRTRSYARSRGETTGTHGL